MDLVLHLKKYHKICIRENERKVLLRFFLKVFPLPCFSSIFIDFLFPGQRKTGKRETPLKVSDSVCLPCVCAYRAFKEAILDKAEFALWLLKFVTARRERKFFSLSIFCQILKKDRLCAFRNAPTDWP